VRTFLPLWPILLAVVTSMLLIDIAWRRLNVTDWVRRTAPRPLASSTGTGNVMGAFRSVKSGHRDVQQQREALRTRIETRVMEVAGEPSGTATLTPPPDAGTSASDTTTTSGPKPKPGTSEGYANRLMVAKKRAAQQIEERKEQ